MNLSTFFKEYIKKNIFLGLFIYFSISHGQVFFSGFPELLAIIKGGAIYQLFLTIVLLVGIHFFTPKYREVVRSVKLILENNRTKIADGKLILGKLAAALIGAGLFFSFYSSSSHGDAKNRTLTVHFDSPIEIKYSASTALKEIQNIDFIDSSIVSQPWQLFFHTKSGYSAIESSEVIPNKRSISFLINTPSPFSKLRMDPGGERITQLFDINQIVLKEEGITIDIIEGERLGNLVKPLQQASGIYDSSTKLYKVVSTEAGDPQLEFNIGAIDFSREKKERRNLALIYALILFLVSFFGMYFWKEIKQKILGASNSKGIIWGVRTIVVFLTILLSFLLLSNRSQFAPLKFVIVEFGEKMEIPQDQWRIYLNIEGFKEIHSTAGLKYGNKVVFPIWTVRPFSNVRIDPGISSQTFFIKKVTYTSGLEKLGELKGKILFKKLAPFQQISDLSYQKKASQIRLRTEDIGDPAIVFALSNKDFKDNNNDFEIILSSLIALLVAIFFSIGGIKSIVKHKQKWIGLGLLANIPLFILFLLALGDINYSILVLILIWLFVLPGKLIAEVIGFQTDTLLSSGVLALGIGISIILTSFFPFYAFNIEGMDFVPIYLGISLSICFVFKRLIRPTMPFTEYFKSKITFTNLLELSIFNFLILFYLVPIADLLAAPLHDPSVTSMLAQKVLDANFIKSAITAGDYPPYLHLTTALLSDLSGLITPKIVLFLTNFFVILTGITFGFFLKSSFKNKYAFPISVLVIMFIDPKIPSLYFESGKNAMVTSFYFWFLIFFLSKEIFSTTEKPNFLKGVIFTLILITGFLFHYLTVVIIPAILIIFFINFYDEFCLIGIKKTTVKYMKYGMSFLIPGIMFMALFFLQEKSILHLSNHQVNPKARVGQKTNVSPSSPNNITAVQPTNSKDTKAIKEEKESRIISLLKKSSTFIGYAWVQSKSKAIGFLSLLKHFLQDYSSGMSIFKLHLLASITSWILLFLLFFTRWKRETVIVLSISFVIFIMIFSSSYNVALYGKTMRFFPSILVFGLFINVLFDKIKTNPLLCWLAILGLGILTSQTLPLLYYEYYNAKRYSTLTQADLDAFDYIDEHLAQETGYFIPVNASDLVFKNTIPFDGYLYLNLSKARLAIAFVKNEDPELSHLDLASFRISLAHWIGKDARADILYSTIKERDKYFDIKSLFDKMRDLNIRYVYSGAHSAWNRLVSIERLKNEGCLELIYEKKGARIFKLVDE